MSTIYLHHDSHFDLVLDESGDNTSTVVTNGESFESLGTYEVETRGGQETRHKIGVDAPENVTVVRTELDGATVRPIELTHLIDTLTDRHAPSESITGVSGDDAKLVSRLAALLGVDVVEAPGPVGTEPDAPATLTEQVGGDQPQDTADSTEDAK